MNVDLRHPVALAPGPETTLWRYQSLTKLLALLTSRQLFFSQLRSFHIDDPFEGSPTSATMRFMERVRSEAEFAEGFFAQFERNTDWQPSDEARQNFRKSFLEMTSGQYQRLGESCFVSCWHQGEFESAALWRLYGNLQDGVAIKTRVASLVGSLKGDGELIGGSVKYLDFDELLSTFDNELSPVFMKRLSFEYEREFRLVLWQPANPAGDVPNFAGRLVDCDLDELIEELVISPYAPEWVADTVERTVAALGWTGLVRRSRLLTR